MSVLKLQDVFPASDKTANKVLTGLLALTAFFLPFKYLSTGLVVLTFIAWLCTNPFKELFTANRFTKILVALLIFDLLYVLSFLYTSNIQETFTSLENKMSFVAFPLVFYTASYKWPQMKFFIKCFVFGSLLYCVCCLLRSTFLYFDPKTDFDPFFYGGLSWFMHPSYLSMYFTFSCVVILQKKIFTRWQNLLCVLFFTFFILLLSSKTGIAIHFLFLLMVGVSYFVRKGNYLKVGLFALVSITVLVLIVSLVRPVRDRFMNVVGALGSDKVDKTATESTAVRMLIWGEAKKIIAEHPVFGVSPGDANDVLYAHYKEDGLTGAYEKKLNAHNQYLQTTIGLGFVGLASLLSLFVIPFFMRPRRLLVFFLLIVAVNFMTESMLQAIAGSAFFGYFYALLCFDKEAAVRNERKIT